MNRNWIACLCKFSAVLAGACVLAVGAVTSARAQTGAPVVNAPSADVRLDQKLNAQVPLDLTFRDEYNKSVPLKSYFHDRPAILVMPFYQCTGNCTLELNSLLACFKQMNLNVGEDFQVLTVSIDPRENAELAASKKQTYLDSYGRPKADEGWHFLTGDESSIKPLAEAVGYHYKWDEARKQYNHPIGIMILTPDGKVSRYFLGAFYHAKDLRLSLVEASENKIGTWVDQAQLLCYHFDPLKGRYTVMINRVLQIAGVITILCLGMFLFLMIRMERRRTLNSAGLPPVTDKPGSVTNA